VRGGVGGSACAVKDKALVSRRARRQKGQGERDARGGGRNGLALAHTLRWWAVTSRLALATRAASGVCGGAPTKSAPPMHM
jgi:hypothetical protein